MNKNRNLKIVWMIGSVAILLLFCTQAYWLYNQYEYSIEKSIEQFEKDCDQILNEDFRNRKLLADKSVKKGHQHKLSAKIETKYDFKENPHCRTSISFWDNKLYLGKMQEPNITGDDAYEMYSRYAANLYRKPTVSNYQSLLKKKGYDEIKDFHYRKYKNVFLNARFEEIGKWKKEVVVHYQNNPVFREGISFVVPISMASILKTMFWQLIGSVLLFIILASCLYYLVKTIVVQKRIDGIRHEFLKNMIYEMKQPKIEENADETAVFIGSIAFCYSRNELQRDNARVIVTSRQAEILRLLASHQNQLVERETILREVWGDDSYSNSLALNVQISYLRRALNLDSSVVIEAVIKKGYILKTKV